MKPIRQNKESNIPEKLFIFGRHPVEEVLLDSPRRVQKIFFRNGIDPTFRKKIETYTAKFKIPATFIDEKKIRSLVGDVHDQGIIAEISGITYADLKEWLGTLDFADNPACVVLDELEDPHNVGAIIRTAAAFGVSGVIIGKHNQAPITGTVIKSSAGTALKVPIIRVNNINAALDTLKDGGFWLLGLDTHGKKNIWNQDMDMPTCFIVGSEESGIREQTLKRCDFTVTIPMNPAVESLNASVSTAIVLSEWKRQQK